MTFRKPALLLVVLLACGRGASPPESTADAAIDSSRASAASSATVPPTTDAPKASADGLVTAFRRAHERRDVSTLLALFELGCATDKIRTLTEQGLRSHLEDPIQAARIEPPMANRVKSYVRDGTTYELNVPLDGELVIVYDTATGRRSSYPVGTVKGVRRLGSMCPR
jgi:hypothetical protein